MRKKQNGNALPRLPRQGVSVYEIICLRIQKISAMKAADIR